MKLMVGHAHLTTHTSVMLFKEVRRYYDNVAKVYGGTYSDEYIIGKIRSGNIVIDKPEYNDRTTLPIPNTYTSYHLDIGHGVKFELKPNIKNVIYVVFDPEVTDEEREEYLKDI